MVLSPSVLCSFRRHLKHDETCRHSSAHRQGKWSQGKDGELQSFPPTNMAVCATAFEYLNLSGVSVGLQITQKCSLDKTFILKSPYNLLKWPPNGLGRWHTHVYKHPKAHMNTPYVNIPICLYYIHIKTTKQLQRCHSFQTKVPTSWWQLPSEQLCRGDKTDHTTLAKPRNTGFVDSGKPLRSMSLSTSLFVLPFEVKYFLKIKYPSLTKSFQIPRKFSFKESIPLY